jgi:O-antigen ligase
VDAVEINLDNEEGWRLSFEKANPISLGHAAVTTILAAMCIESRSLMARLLALIAAAIALACLLLTAARGPIIALVLCSLIYVWITKRWALVMTIVLLALPFILVEDSLVIARFSGLTADEIIEESAIYRIEVQGGAFAQFLDNPFLGSAYTELKHLTYPHNMILETTMALGMLGLLLLIPLLKNGASRAAQMARAGQYLPALLLLQYFINEMLSGSLATSTAFWTLLVVVLRSKT